MSIADGLSLQSSFRKQWIEYPQGGAAGHKLQPLRDSRVRFMISVALMPRSIAGNIHPICHQPDFIRHVLRAEDIHPDKPRGIVNEMRTEKERLLDSGIHVICNDKPAQNANRWLFQFGNPSERLYASLLPRTRNRDHFQVRLHSVEKACAKTASSYSSHRIGVRSRSPSTLGVAVYFCSRRSIQLGSSMKRLVRPGFLDGVAF
jgi:hypothetical protein